MNKFGYFFDSVEFMKEVDEIFRRGIAEAEQEQLPPIIDAQ